MVLGLVVQVSLSRLDVPHHYPFTDGKLDVGPENTAGIIDQKFLKHSHAEDGMQLYF